MQQRATDQLRTLGRCSEDTPSVYRVYIQPSHCSTYFFAISKTKQTIYESKDEIDFLEMF